MNCQDMVQYFQCLRKNPSPNQRDTLFFFFSLKDTEPLTALIKGHNKSIYKIWKHITTSNNLVQLSIPDGKLLKWMKSLPVSHHPLHFSLSFSFKGWQGSVRTERWVLWVILVSHVLCVHMCVYVCADRKSEEISWQLKRRNGKKLTEDKNTKLIEHTTLCCKRNELFYVSTYMAVFD